MYKGSLTFETPMLFSLAFLFLFTIGGFSGLMLAIVPADYQYHDTYFVVAHFHYVLVPGAIFGLMSGTYYWLPKWTGHMYNETLGKWHFWLSAIFVNVTFFPNISSAWLECLDEFRTTRLSSPISIWYLASVHSDSVFPNCSLFTSSGAAQKAVKRQRHKCGKVPRVSNGQCHRQRLITHLMKHQRFASC